MRSGACNNESPRAETCLKYARAGRRKQKAAAEDPEADEPVDFDCVNDAYVRLMVPLRVKGFDKRRDARKTDDGRWSLTDEFMDAVALQMMIDRDRDSEAVFARKMDEDDDALARWVMNEWLPMRNSRTPPVDEGCGAC